MVAPIDAVLAPQTKPVVPTPLITSAFWQEFLRVQVDKFLLLALIIFLHHIGDTEGMRYAVGGLIAAINHNRFRWN